MYNVKDGAIRLHGIPFHRTFGKKLRGTNGEVLIIPVRFVLGWT